MNYVTRMYGKPINIEISERAERKLQTGDKPLVADINLIFGCMVAKRLWFKDRVEGKTFRVNDRLDISLHVVRYAVCSLENIDGGVEPEPFPLKKEMGAYVPDQVSIDFRKKGFTGSFSYRSPDRAREPASEPIDRRPQVAK